MAAENGDKGGRPSRQRARLGSAARQLARKMRRPDPATHCAGPPHQVAAGVRVREAALFQHGGGRPLLAGSLTPGCNRPSPRQARGKEAKESSPPRSMAMAGVCHGEAFRRAPRGSPRSEISRTPRRAVDHPPCAAAASRQWLCRRQRQRHRRSRVAAVTTAAAARARLRAARAGPRHGAVVPRPTMARWAEEDSRFSHSCIQTAPPIQGTGGPLPWSPRRIHP